MAETKKLSLIHLERGLALMGKVNEEEGAATEMVAVYLASPGQLYKAKKDPAVMEVLLEQASEMDGEEASVVISSFFAQCVEYSSNIIASLPEISDEVKARIIKAQSTSNT